MKIILASGSERRKKIFQILFNDFYQVIPDIYENDDFILNSVLKSKNGLIKFVENNQFNDNILSIGADTVISYNNMIYGKFYKEEDVKNFFVEISGKWHYVITAVTITDIKYRKITFVDKSKVKFRSLSLDEIQRYIKTKEWVDVAGGYRIQGIGGIMVERYKGSFSNIIGFPVEKFFKYYNKFVKQF